MTMENSLVQKLRGEFGINRETAVQVLKEILESCKYMLNISACDIVQKDKENFELRIWNTIDMEYQSLIREILQKHKLEMRKTETQIIIFSR